MQQNNKIHPKSNVRSTGIGARTRVWQFVTIGVNAVVGNDCNICDFCFIESNVIVGNNVTLKCGVYLWDGLLLEDNVFVGPNVTFTNDKYPRSKGSFELEKTILKKGCSLGANATILGGITIGEYALIGAGSVVTKNVVKNALIVGNPGRQVGWVDNQGNKLSLNSNGILYSPESGVEYIEVNGQLELK